MNQQGTAKEPTSSTKAQGRSSEAFVFDDGSSRVIPERQFRQMLSRERKRSERSRKHLVLMLIDSELLPKSKNDRIILGQMAEAVLGSRP